jgi:uncharacterized protein YbjQ (UPF0145 family)
MRLSVLPALLFVVACGPKSAGISYPTIDGVTNIKGASNAQLVGQVSGKASSHYKGCAGLTEKAYENMALEAKKRGANAVGEFKWKSGNTITELPTVTKKFLLYYWGCGAMVTAEAYKLSE